MPGLSAKKLPSVPRMSTEPVKVLCFDTLLQVLILKVVRGVSFCPPPWTAKTAAAPAKMTEFLGKVEIKKRQTSRRIEDVPHFYLVSTVAKELWGVKRFLPEQWVSFRLPDLLGVSPPRPAEPNQG